MTQNTQPSLPLIAIIGKPNVGKSSLFNRLIKKRIAITSEIAGTTRDRIYSHLELTDLDAILIDSGGLEYDQKKDIEQEIQLQAKIAIKEAHLILFIVDAFTEPTIDDLETAKMLRKATKKVILIANKCDNKHIREHNHADYLKMGFGNPLKISAIHNFGIDELKEKLTTELSEDGWHTKLADFEKENKSSTHIAFVGRPNVGKSSLVNAIFGSKKVIESDIAGTTRDSIDVEVTYNDHQFNLIDTAGIRRRGKIERGIEKYSTLRSLEAIERSDLVCLILDFEQGIRSQDTHIASYILEAGKGLVIIVNKVDLMPNKNEDENRMIRILKSRFDFLPWAPVIFTSALKKTNINVIFDLTLKIEQERRKILDEIELEHFLKAVTSKHQTPVAGRYKIVIKKIKQMSVNPPTFEIFTNYPEKIHFSYKRYIENQLREKFGFNGTTIRIFYKKLIIPRQKRI